MATKELIDVARHWWLLLAVAALLGGLLGQEVTNRAPAEFRTEVRLLVGPLNGDTEALRAAGLLVQTYAAVLSSDDVLRRAANAGGVPTATSMDDLRKAVTVTSNPRTRVVTLEVTFGSRERVRRVADSLTQQISQRVAEDVARQEQQLAETRARADVAVAVVPVGVAGRISVIDGAQAPIRQLDVPVQLYTLISAIVSAAVAFGLVLLLTSGGRRSTTSGLQEMVNRRLLGTCQLDNGGMLRRRRRAVVARRPASAEAMDYRLIAAKSELLATTTPLTSLAVFGGRYSTGSGEVAANLALTFAQGGRTVAVVDLCGGDAVADRLLRHDGIRKVEKIGDFVLETSVPKAGSGRVAVVLSQDPALNAAPKESAVVRDLLRSIADLVIVHAPPLLQEPATIVIATQVDGVAVVAAEHDGLAAIEGVNDAMDALERVEASVLGAIVAVGRPVRESAAETREVASEAAARPPMHFRDAEADSQRRLRPTFSRPRTTRGSDDRVAVQGGRAATDR